MQNVIHIGLVEDQQLFRDGLKSILDHQPGFQVVFESGDGHSVLQKLEEAATLPEVMLIDLSLPPYEGGEFSGLDVVQALRSHYPDIVPMILSVHDDPYLITQLIQQGAMGYLLKSSKSKEIFAAVEAAYSSGSYINEHTLQAIQGRLNGKLNRSQGPSALTRREEEVLTLICQQLTAEEIGERLFISPKTVDGHRNNLLQKTGSRNITGLVIYAVKHKLVSVV